MGGWGQAGSYKVADKGYIFTKTSQMASIGATTYHTKQLNPWPNSSASCVVNYIATAGCLLVQGICSHLKVTWALVDVWQASETSHSKSSLGNFQHQYMAELLVNVSNYRLMVKSVSWCRVRGRWLISNLVTFCICSLVIHCHTVIDKVNKRISKSIWGLSWIVAIFSMVLLRNR